MNRPDLHHMALPDDIGPLDWTPVNGPAAHACPKVKHGRAARCSRHRHHGRKGKPREGPQHTQHASTQPNTHR